MKPQFSYLIFAKNIEMNYLRNLYEKGSPQPKVKNKICELTGNKPADNRTDTIFLLTTAKEEGKPIEKKSI